MTTSAIALWDRIRPLGAWHLLRTELRRDVEVIASHIGSAKWLGAAILPIPRGDRPIVFYIVAEDGKAWRRIQPWLTAFGGPTFSDFQGQPYLPDNHDDIELIINDAQFEYVARLNPAQETEALLCRALRRLCEMVTKIPVGGRAFPESRERILTRFFDAVAAGNLTAALGAVGQLRAGLHLDAPNLRFLEVHAYATFGDWAAISGRPDFLSLLEAPKPPDVSRALLEALYRREMADEVNAGDFEAAVFHWRNVRRSYLRQGLPPFSVGSAEVARLYALDALASGTSPPWRNVLAQSDLGALAQPFAQRFPDKSIQEGEDEAVDPVLNVFAVLVRAHNGTLADKRLALLAVDQLGPSDRQRLLSAPGFSALLSELRQQASDQPPNNWVEWIDNLASSAFVECAPELARMAADEWLHAVALPNPGAFSEALKIHSTNLVSRNSIRRSLPHITHWLRTDPEGPRIGWRSVYLAIVEIYALADRDWIDGDARAAAMTMIDCLLGAGPAPSEYGDLIDCVRELVPASTGPGGAPWLLELIENLLWYDTPDRASRDALCHFALDALRPILPRLSPGLRLSARTNADLVGWTWPESSPISSIATSKGVADQLAGKTIAIYSLVERAAEQARTLLLTLAPASRVETLADRTNSVRLTRLARTADLFVMVTWAATHAATDAIRAARPKNSPLLMPIGKGASSIIDAIEHWAEGAHA
jgi:hypothetical protein